MQALEFSTGRASGSANGSQSQNGRQKDGMLVFEGFEHHGFSKLNAAKRRGLPLFVRDGTIGETMDMAANMSITSYDSFYNP